MSQKAEFSKSDSSPQFQSGNEEVQYRLLPMRREVTISPPSVGNAEAETDGTSELWSEPGLSKPGSEDDVGDSERKLGSGQFLHSETVLIPGVCVDRQCQCVDGVWHCFDYCTPLDQLPCAAVNVVVWDPFCCPRCMGRFFDRRIHLNFLIGLHSNP
ncbi:unnamed protein product [Protopolystoma xenopodis]|uniref:VWFC domain-containing protein n=1 Tax=Protopolystoma xenopodis TaxID=117903 RepID=A0A448X0F5_9PLAT|nr:unnamed protein product [Protopolystoma xenopodis]